MIFPTVPLFLQGVAEHMVHGPGTITKLISESEAGTPLMKSAVVPAVHLTTEDVTLAADYVRSHEDHSSYLLLFALRRDAPEIFRHLPGPVKARILCDALAHLTFLNDWGYLDPAESHDGEAARALLELKGDAVPGLQRVLDDSRPAPLFGSEPATLSATYRYRRKDFAYRYLLLILGERPVFDPHPEARDRKIENLKRILERRSVYRSK